MKRSEMFEKLCEPIEIHDVNLRLFPSEARAILDRLEQLGMKPPLNPTKSSLGMNYGLKTKCSWEPEDETQ